MQPATTLIQKHLFVRRVVAVGLFISVIAFVAVIDFEDRLGSFFTILLALLVGYWLAAIYSYLLPDHSGLRAHMPASGRNAVLWFVIVMSFIVGGAFMAVILLLGDGTWNVWKQDDS